MSKSEAPTERLNDALANIDDVMGVTQSVRKDEPNAAERGRLKRARRNLESAVGHIQDYIRERAEDEFRADVASNFDVDADDLDVESEVVDGTLVCRARWSP